jgi:uncharacterized protein (TIGR03435 family)
MTNKPPAHLPEFEVAAIKPEAPDVHGTYVRLQQGGQVRVSGTLKGLIAEAWGDVNPDRIVGGPKSIDTTQWVVVAKAPATELTGIGVLNGVDIDTMRMMLRALLIDRFKLATHFEDRLQPGYALVLAQEKLRKADPANRPGCREGPGDNGNDPRIANPVASRLVTCRNVTLAQFTAQLSNWSSEENHILFRFPPVMDATGLKGRYDMTINFSPSAALPNIGFSSAGANGVAFEPDGSISIFDAVNKQLGLKLNSRKVMAPVLVIDRVNEIPTEN